MGAAEVDAEAEERVVIGVDAATGTENVVAAETDVKEAVERGTDMLGAVDATDSDKRDCVKVAAEEEGDE